MRPRKKNGPRSVSRSDWVAEARRTLVKEGIAGVKVEPLARQLGVTPGSFYWHFEARPALYDALLRDWLTNNVAPFDATFERAAAEPREQYLALAYVWVLSPDFDPKFDVAIREWAKTSPKVARLLRWVDNRRIRLYQCIFEGFGHGHENAFVRARTMYYHQIGYYAMAVEEPLDGRLILVPARSHVGPTLGCAH